MTNLVGVNTGNGTHSKSISGDEQQNAEYWSNFFAGMFGEWKHSSEDKASSNTEQVEQSTATEFEFEHLQNKRTLIESIIVKTHQNCTGNEHENIQ